MKWLCNSCGEHIDSTGDLLTAPNPFRPEEVLTACPKCREHEDIHAACDEPGCWRKVSAGTNTSKGYRNTCYEHMPKRGA